MTLIRLATFVFSLLILTTTGAQAKEYCDKPITMREFQMEVPAHCNVYDRQLAYREERLKFRQMIEDRREEFIKPQLEAERDYESKLKALNKSRSHENDVTGR